MAFVGGLVSMALVVAALQQSGAMAPTLSGQGDLYLSIAAAFWGASALSGVVIARVQAAALRRSREWSTLSGEEVGRHLAQPYVTRVLTRAAILEGPGLFGVVVTLITGHPLGLLPAGLSVGVMLAFFPSMSGFERFRVAVAGSGAHPTA